MVTQYYYFKPSGKWKYEGTGASIEDYSELDHDLIKLLNNGKMPGILGDGKEFTIIIIDPNSYPRMILAERP